MNDRNPTYPGRVKLTDEETGISKYYTLEMADQPTEAGTALNKANLLTDATAAAIAAAFGSTPDTPNEAFALLAGGANLEYQEYLGTNVYGSWANCTTITFAHEPKFVFVIDIRAYADAGPSNFWLMLSWSALKQRFADYPTQCYFGNMYNPNNRCNYRLSNGNKTIEFYATSSYNQAETQMNSAINYAVISFY